MPFSALEAPKNFSMSEQTLRMVPNDNFKYLKKHFLQLFSTVYSKNQWFLYLGSAKHKKNWQEIKYFRCF